MSARQRARGHAPGAARREAVCHDALEVLKESLEGRIPLRGVEREHLEYERVDLRGDAGPYLAGRDGRSLEALPDYRRGVVALERGDSGERVVERAAERVHVGPEVHRLLLHLLRRDVVGRAPYLVRVLLHRREAEVHELRVPVGVEEDVLRLDVSVHKPLVRRAPERLRDLLADLHHAGDVDGRAGVLHELVERAAGHELHGDVGHSVRDAVGVYLGDVRVDQPRRRLGLALELLDELGVVAVLL